MKHLELKVLGYHTRSRGVADKRWPWVNPSIQERLAEIYF